MNTLVVYFSKFGNTKMVAETICETLGSAGSGRMKDSDQLTASDFNEIDLVVMGTPTHNMNLPKSVRPVFERLPKKALKRIPVAAFDTSYKMSWWLNQFTAAKDYRGSFVNWEGCGSSRRRLSTSQNGKARYMMARSCAPENGLTLSWRAWETINRDNRLRKPGSSGRAPF
jgi:flavodoxin